MSDWHAWHAPYDVPGSVLDVRLALVRSHIRQTFDAAPPGEIRVVSMCAGEGRDLLGVLSSHERARDVRARLVELDPVNAGVARASVAELEGSGAVAGGSIEVLEADASRADHYLDLLPAHLVLCCGVFGHLSDDDVRAVVESMPRLLVPGGTFVWTRHRRAPDLTPNIRGWCASAGLEEVSFDAPRHLGYVSVGAAQLAGEPAPPPEAGSSLFTWIGEPHVAS